MNTKDRDLIRRLQAWLVTSPPERALAIPWKDVARILAMFITEPKRPVYEPETTSEQRAAIRDVLANNPLLDRGMVAVIKDLDRAEASLGIENTPPWQSLDQTEEKP